MNLPWLTNRHLVQFFLCLFFQTDGVCIAIVYASLACPPNPRTLHSYLSYTQQKVAGVMMHQRGARVNGSRGVVDSFICAEEAAKTLFENLCQVHARARALAHFLSLARALSFSLAFSLSRSLTRVCAPPGLAKAIASTCLSL